MSRPARNHNQAERLTDAQREEYGEIGRSLIKELSFFTDVFRKDVDALADLWDALRRR